MEENPLLDLFAKHLFKNVKRRRLSEGEKQRLRAVANEIQTYLDSMQANNGTDEVAARDGKAKKPRRRFTLRGNY